MWTEGIEREIKLIVADDFEMPPLVGKSTGVAGVVEEGAQNLDAVYFDTPDLRLLSQGITVRRRTGETDCPLWTVKLPINGDKTLRNEVTLPGEASKPPAEIASLLRSILADEEVRPVVELKTRRVRWLLVNPGRRPLAELSDDRVAVLDGDEVRSTFREIEVEAREVDAEGLKRIAHRIRKAGGKREQVSKASRALEMIRNGPPRAGDKTVRPDDPVATAVQSTISDLTRSMVAHAPNAFLGYPEGVHRMRVGQRHLRSILRAFGPIVDKQRLASFVEELRWLGVVLGAVRDLDVFEAYLRESAGEDESLSPLLAGIEARVSNARVQLQEALNSDRYVGLIRASRELSADKGLVLANGTCQEELIPLAAMAADRLREAGRSLTPNSPGSDYHEVRKLAKRARYTAETVAGFLKPKQQSTLRHFAARVTPVQDVFGEQHDAAVARDRLIAIASEEFASDGAMTLRIGRLVERADQRASRLRKACLRLWSKLDKDDGTKWPRA